MDIEFIEYSPQRRLSTEEEEIINESSRDTSTVHTVDDMLNTIRQIDNKVIILLQQQKYSEALLLMESLLQLKCEYYGVTHLTTAMAMTFVAGTIRKNDPERYQDAYVLYHQASSSILLKNTSLAYFFYFFIFLGFADSSSIA
jgi:hypothetical protein